MKKKSNSNLRGLGFYLIILMFLIILITSLLQSQPQTAVTYSQVIDFVLKARHRVINMRSLLLQAADECRWLREWSNFLNEPLNKKG